METWRRSHNVLLCRDIQFYEAHISISTGSLRSTSRWRKFVNHDSPDACEKLTDKLLESERCRERWDLERYANASGFEIDCFHTAAGRYRDLVSDSFIKD